jgi:hypothetical protein
MAPRAVSKTQPRQQMLSEVRRRNYSQGTIAEYLRLVGRFARYFGWLPDQFGTEHVLHYQAHLLQERRLSVVLVVAQRNHQGSIGLGMKLADQGFPDTGWRELQGAKHGNRHVVVLVSTCGIVVRRF